MERSLVVLVCGGLGGWCGPCGVGVSVLGGVGVSVLGGVGVSVFHGFAMRL